MLSRRLLLFALLTLLAFALAWWKVSRFRPSAPAPAAATEVVPIEDGKTIDFSNGQPVVRDDAADRAALEKALAEMKAVEAETTLPPRPKQPEATDPP